MTPSVPWNRCPPDPAGHAPGAPGIPPSWTTSDKDLVGTAIGSSRLWFTLGHGIVNEVYYPRIDIPQIRDLGFIVSDDAGFWVEVKRGGDYTLAVPAPGVPLPRITHRHPRFKLHLNVCPDATRDVLLIDLTLEAEDNLRVHVLLAPHLGGTGRDNLAEATTHLGHGVLWARQGPFGLALLGRTVDGGDALRARSTGYVGVSDGWQDFAANGRMAWHYAEAGPGNVALMAEVAPRATLALGLATSKHAAAALARAALMQPFAVVREQQIAAWAGWHQGCQLGPAGDLPDELRAQLACSAQVLKTHSDKTFLGAMVASLSVPWGNRGEERGGYHLVWPRDLVESAQALLALGSAGEARAVLGYLMATQNADGHWNQNQWLGGKPYWGGIQLDETAFPVLLAVSLAERDALGGMPVADSVRRALAFLILHGPASPQDRWEEDAGVNPFTLAVCIAALVAGAMLLPEPERALPLAVADFWNARLEDWCVARDTALGAHHDVAAYYVREAPRDILCDDRAMQRVLPINNHSYDLKLPAEAQIATDFLQLVRLGLRRADDALICDTLVLVDALLKTDTPAGPVWHRYNGDGYGEHQDGRAFDGAGRGRGWPLLTGERGHYELARGHDPLAYLQAMNAMASHGLIPEQVWDSAPLGPFRPGYATGSAMPLAWAHAEFIKLIVSRAAGWPIDRPAAVWARYGGQRPALQCTIWTPGAPLDHCRAQAGLWIVLPRPAVVHLGFDGWHDAADRPTAECGLALHGLRLEAAQLAGRRQIDFTWRDTREDCWHEASYTVALA
jgi:glucoamylase